MESKTHSCYAVIVFLLCWAGAVQSQDTTTGLIARWECNDGSGTSLADATGNGHTGTLSNGAFFVPGAVQLDGADDRITIGASNSYSLTTEVTLAAWIKTSTANWQRVLTFLRAADSTALGLSTGEGVGSTNAADGKLTGAYRNAANAFTTVRSTGTIHSNTWRHVALTIAGTTITLYIDGVQDGQATDLHAANTLALTANTAGIGVYSGTSVSLFWNGQLDHLRVYNRGLTAADIAAVYTLDGTVLVRRRLYAN